MNDDDKYFLDPKGVDLFRYKMFFHEYNDRYRMMINIYEEGLKRIHKNITDSIRKSNLRYDIGGYAEDKFTILEEIDGVDSNVFRVCIIVTMYSECELALKQWVKYLSSDYLAIRDFEDLEKKYKAKGIDLPQLPGYENLYVCLRLLNNNIKHNGGIAGKDITCHCLSKVFKKGDAIQLSEGQLIQLAENVSQFMINVLDKVSEKYSDISREV